MNWFRKFLALGLCLCLTESINGTPIRPSKPSEAASLSGRELGQQNPTYYCCCPTGLCQWVNAPCWDDKEPSALPLPLVSVTQMRHLIMPHASASLAEREAFEANLTRALGESHVHRADDDLHFWVAMLSSSQVDEFHASSVISTVVPDNPIPLTGIEPIFGPPSGYINLKPAGRRRADISVPSNLSHVAFQPNALDELKVFSQGQDADLKPFPLSEIDYQYDDSAGRGITVYVIDSGATPSHVEYSRMPGRVRWIFPSIKDSEPAEEDYSDNGSHGTAVMSKVSGPVFGTAKNVDVVVVKIHTHWSDFDAVQIMTSASEFATSLLMVKKDIEANKLRDKAVINLSMGMKPEFLIMEMRHLIEKTVRDITSLGVPLIVSAGNNGKLGGAVNAWPQLLAETNEGIVLVGSSDDAGNLAEHSSYGPLVKLYAPGNNISCALADTLAGHTESKGTSLAAPAVAGLAAIFLGLATGVEGSGQVLAENMKRHLIEKAYPRVNGTEEVLKVAWSGFDGRPGEGHVRSCEGHFTGCFNGTGPSLRSRVRAL